MLYSRFLLVIYFIYSSVYEYRLFFFFLAALGLRCCVWAFSSCGQWGLLFVAVCGLLIVVAYLCCGARALGVQASVVVAHGLSCSAACGILPDQGSKPCLLHWQADSFFFFFKDLFIYFIFIFGCIGSLLLRMGFL